MNEVKNNIWIKIIKLFYRIDGPIDEYKEKEINRIGNNAFIFSSTYMVITNLIIIFFFKKINYDSLQLILALNLLIYVLIISMYVSKSIEKARLDFVNITINEFPIYKKKAVRISLITGFLYAAFYTLIYSFLNTISDGTNYFSNLCNKTNLIMFIILGIFCTYVDYQRKIKLITKNIKETEKLEIEDED